MGLISKIRTNKVEDSNNDTNNINAISIDRLSNKT